MNDIDLERIARDASRQAGLTISTQQYNIYEGDFHFDARKEGSPILIHFSRYHDGIVGFYVQKLHEKGNEGLYLAKASNDIGMMYCATSIIMARNTLFPVDNEMQRILADSNFLLLANQGAFGLGRRGMPASFEIRFRYSREKIELDQIVKFFLYQFNVVPNQ
ncbi:hypothetical protein HYX04_04215 [Candidatus Woesearchaeota archaeon]|nr:hypothetical protein [Candidatus Woesearchaeota archaeon]